MTGNVRGQGLKRAEKKAFREALADLRDRFRDEIEPTIKTLIAIRDNPEVPWKERINASKELRNYLGVFRPAVERPVEPPPPPKDEHKTVAPELPANILKEVTDIIVGNK